MGVQIPPSAPFLSVRQLDTRAKPPAVFLSGNAPRTPDRPAEQPPIPPAPPEPPRPRPPSSSTIPSAGQPGAPAVTRSRSRTCRSVPLFLPPAIIQARPARPHTKPAAAGGTLPGAVVPDLAAAMRPRGRPRGCGDVRRGPRGRNDGFNEAAGVDPADARHGRAPTARRRPRFNEAAGVDPADVDSRTPASCPPTPSFDEAAGVDPADGLPRRREPRREPRGRFNEAAGVDPADAVAAETVKIVSRRLLQ